MTFEQIISDIRSRKFSPIYLFMGDEPYYIDELTDMLTATVLPEEERDFNQTVLYGMETDVASVITLARSFPMMSEYQLVVVKEAQNLSKIDELEVYAKNPLHTTILVLNYKNGTLDKRKKLSAAIEKNGVIFESKKIPEYKIPAFITSYIKTKGLDIDQKSAQMLSDYLGNDLSKLTNEIAKLLIAIPAGQQRITAELIEENIGISKDFNNFELLKAIIDKNIYKVNQIADYFEKNPKNNPLIVTLVVLFNFFSNLMICYWAKNKTEQGIAAELGFRNPYQAKDYVAALRNYNAFKCMEIIALLRTYDAKCKGVNNISASDGELLKELLYKITH
ncbi:DNA polymerase-3 subunit delta [Dysgonomonas sp. PFB1-18]|uniref:DNA polymerase III subunit delta n=1 Tax=unclassified Dysgonomonas TaxID=2630389 RepID=UPI002476C001|nr:MULTISPECIES: DNA polymerase III subunit delta [unclassified Dysgonomonas]MDH6308337.1 DNA polymerase-3 subunit delta [Dysgonomonas sp. PF1-14]MDH6338226.1 DNA polymerase-3 subunit delta [Dysgonomonas sp. PF1-16]MDH6379723.1 DNA polymerase-3 subunit delta [Dysgonomonas sp. PFB1-18]MDH6397188.1 DNA polymerase-3 subunit delta [Dysgonomonas sp. PF1-23]